MTDCGPDPATRLEQVRAAVAGGVDWVQLRDRSAGSSDLLAFADALRGICDRTLGIMLLINRRVDIALMCDADGAHLGFDAPPLAAVQTCWAAAKGAAPGGLKPLLGVSTHSAHESLRAVQSGAHYVHLAPIYPPLSKRGQRASLGPAALLELQRAGCPVIAQGGIEVGRVNAVVEAGARGVAVTGAILGADDCERAARELRVALDRCGAGE